MTFANADDESRLSHATATPAVDFGFMNLGLWVYLNGGLTVAAITEISVDPRSLLNRRASVKLFGT